MTKDIAIINNMLYVAEMDQIFCAYSIINKTGDNKLNSYEIVIARNAIEAYIVALNRGYNIHSIQMYPHD